MKNNKYKYLKDHKNFNRVNYKNNQKIHLLIIMIIKKIKILILIL
jgi:hypothetical protein